MPSFKLFQGWSEGLAVGALVLVAVVIYSSFSWGLPASRYNSPDEAANAYFARRLAKGESLAASASLNKVAGEPIVHPRSTVVLGDSLVPASFLGLPLVLGYLGRILGECSIPFFTPLAAALGLTCFYLILRELFSRRVAALATLLLALLPSFWYYHARSLFHNALFFDTLLLAIWALLKLIRTKHWGYYFATGLAVGLALTFRTSEIFWVTAAGLVWLILARSEIKWRYLWLLPLGAVIGFSPVLFANYSIYGQLLTVGYKAGAPLQLNSLDSAASLVSELALPFGFHPRAILSTVGRYLGQITWWWTLLVAAGLAFVVARGRTLSRAQQAFIWPSLIACLWLIVLYGSWSFHDNPDPAAITLGTSYARYWLPLYAFMLWPTGLMLSWFWEQKGGRFLVLALLGVYAILSANLVLYEPQEGLLQVRANVQRFQAWSQIVQSRTEPNSVIVAGTTDKLFWPERQVIVSLARPADYAAVLKLLQSGLPVYRFSPTWRSKDLVYVNQNQLAPFGLKLEPVQQGFQDFSLYRISLATP